VEAGLPKGSWVLRGEARHEDLDSIGVAVKLRCNKGQKDDNLLGKENVA
jgi:hypothetical protein